MSRVDEILAEVHAEIERRRSAGEFPDGYEAGFENVHNAELGKVRPSQHSRSEEVLVRLARLERQISAMSEIERDTSKFRPWRFVRELAMSRPQLIRLNREMRAIAEAISSVAEAIVSTETDRITVSEREARDLLDRVYERTILMEKIWLLVGEIEERVQILESSPK